MGHKTMMSEDNLPIRRGYVDVGTDDRAQLMHYYACGSGPALFMLHPSPMSASLFLPVLKHLGKHVTAIAIDTSGYGYSDPIQGSVDDLAPYCQALDRFRQRIGLQRVTIFGSATGSQVAVEYSKLYPGICHAIILDNVADFPELERNRILDGYFPDLSPDKSGSHLTKIWSLLVDQGRFFPWHDNRSVARLRANPANLDAIQAHLLQYLLAGAEYDKAYQVAFVNERAETLLDVTDNTTIIRSSGSIVKRYADRFDAYEWPDNFIMRHCGPTPIDRKNALIEAVVENTRELPAVRVSLPQVESGRRFTTVNNDNTYEYFVSSPGPAWLLVHDIGSSSTALQAVIDGLAATVTVLAPDLPGHGATDTMCDETEDFVSFSASLLLALIDEKKLDDVNVLVFGQAAPIAFELRAIAGDRVGKIVLHEPLTNIPCYNLSPKLDGSHLATLWQSLRNAELQFPADCWEPEYSLSGEPCLDADYINRLVIDLLRCEPVYAQATKSCVDYDLDAAIRNVGGLIISRCEDSTAGDRSRRCFVAPSDIETETLLLPESTSDWPAILNN